MGYTAQGTTAALGIVNCSNTFIEQNVINTDSVHETEALYL